MWHVARRPGQGEGDLFSVRRIVFGQVSIIIDGQAPSISDSLISTPADGIECPICRERMREEVYIGELVPRVEADDFRVLL